MKPGHGLILFIAFMALFLLNAQALLAHCGKCAMRGDSSAAGTLHYAAHHEWANCSKHDMQAHACPSCAKIAHVQSTGGQKYADFEKSGRQHGDSKMQDAKVDELFDKKS